jgi:hypothetical protein
MYRHVAARHHSWPSSPSGLEVDPLRVQKRSGAVPFDLIVFPFETGIYAEAAVGLLVESLPSWGLSCSPPPGHCEKTPSRLCGHSDCLLRTVVTPGH